MTANHFAVLVLWYGVGYAVLLHSNIWAGLGGLFIVALLAQGSHGDGGGMMVAYALGLVARWVLDSRWFRFASWQGWGWRCWDGVGWFNPWVWLRERWKHKPSGSGRCDSEAGTRAGENSSSHSGDDGARAEAERRRREEEARQRRQQENARKGSRSQQEKQKDEPYTTSSKEEQTKQGSREKETTPDTQTDTRTPEEVLGVRPGCTYEELKQAYRLQCQRLHPDRWQDRPLYIRAMLEEEQKKVNIAFQTLEKLDS